ncbi:MAG: hypothetical protein IJ597_05385 [Synergistaceae bacterium]|nr:hypothetical protein [Synergistaceae bacterium]
MKTINFNLNAEVNGGKITAFNYSRSLNELIGTWNAEVAGGTFKAGNSISIGGVLTNGIITNAYKDNTGLWHLEGKDAGVKLMKSTPDISELPTGGAQTVIQYLANFCGVSLTMNGAGLSGFNVRSVVSGSTCAEAILELAMLSGLIAYVNNSGVLVVAAPSGNSVSFSDIINDSGSSIDLDGYATQVLVSLTNKAQDESKKTYYYTGKNPSEHTSTDSSAGSFSVNGTHGTYNITNITPFDIPQEITTSITKDGITVTTIEKHDSDIRHKYVTRDNTKYLLWAYCEIKREVTKTVIGTYNSQNFKEVTTETLTRGFGNSNPLDVPEDWRGSIKMVDEEHLTRQTVRTGAPAPKEKMPAYSPPFDCKIDREFKRKGNFTGIVVCNETETRYEERQVGSISPVKIDDKLVPHFMLDSNLAIQTHSTPQWIPIKTYRIYCDQYDINGNCTVSAKSEYCDDGAEWLSENGISDTGDEELNEYEKAYAAFTQNSQGLEVNIGSSQIDSFWSYMEEEGQTKRYGDPKDNVDLGDVTQWYDSENGIYVKTELCPHFNSKKCRVYAIEATGENGQEFNEYCTFSNPRKGWRPTRTYAGLKGGCERARKALEEAIKQDASEVTPAYIGTASIRDSTAVGYRRDIYIDEVLDEGQAQEIANTIAVNILKVKSNKGIRKTVTIPYNASVLPTGTITEVSHDWANMQTSVTYLEEGDIPECLISQSVASIATFVSARENARRNIPQYGVVIKCKLNEENEEKEETTQNNSDDINTNEKLLVRIGNNSVPCTTRLKNIGVNDIVLVTFAAGNKVRGQVIARL